MTTKLEAHLVDEWPDVKSVLFASTYTEVRTALSEPRLIIHKPLIGDKLQTTEVAHKSRRIAHLSSVLSEQLAAREVASLETDVQTMTNEFAQRLQREGKVDAIQSLASPLPLAMMAQLLGLSNAPADELRPIFDRITAGLDFGATTNELLQGRMALQMLIRWVNCALKSLGNPSPLMTAILATAEDQGLDQATVRYWCAMLLYAGSTTTRDFIGNIISAMLTRQDLVSTLLDEPDMLDSAIEELLRIEGPVRGLLRKATEDVLVGNQTARRGQLVCLMLVDANRDPDRFIRPEQLDLHRSPNPHLALGANLTYCLGSHLARMEAKNMLKKLLPLLPYITTCSNANWSSSRLLRGHTSLMLNWHG